MPFRSLPGAHLCLAVLLAYPWTVRAQAAPPAQSSAAPLKWSATLRSRAEAWDWFDAGDEGKYAFLGSYLRAGLSQELRTFGWRLEIMAPLLLGLPDDAVLAAPQGQLGQGANYFAANDGETDVADVFPKEVYVRLGRPPGRDGHALRLGRFEFADGVETTPPDAAVARLKRERLGHRLLGNFTFTHVLRSFDGASYAYTSRGRHLLLMAARPTTGVFNSDGWGQVDDVSVLYGALTTPLRVGGEAGDARLFGLWYEDKRRVTKVDNRPAPARDADVDPVRVTTFGGHLLQVFPTGSGPVDLLLWGALQTGAWGALDHAATAVALELGVQPPLGDLQPWLRIGLFRGSGDGDAADADHDTFFQVLPTPRPYARFPFYDFSNTTEVFATAALHPHPVATVRAGARRVRLSESADLWYTGGGAFEDDTFGYTGRPGGAGGLATIFDLSLTVAPANWVTVEAYGALAPEDDVIRSIYPEGSTGRLAYVEVELRR
ncbi:MAG TPA: alginate export family protein [Gemmatimonadales bacterium]|nr:alginate export family protein [Gemmatimonadales bacterium]